MPFAVAAAAIAVGGTVYASNKAAKTSKAGIDAQRELAGDANQLSQDRFEWDKWVYENDIAPANKANQELQLMLSEDYLDTSKSNRDFANEQRDEYRRTYLPNERKVAAEAADYDSDSNVAIRSGKAAANVNQQFSNAIGQRARAAGRYGLSSSAFTNQLSKDSLAQAAAASGAATGAAFETKDKAIALRSGVANFGRNMPNTAAQANATANASNAGASVTSQRSADAAGAGADFMSGAYGNRVGGLYNYGNTIGSASRQESALWGGVAQGLGSLAGAGVNAAGGWGSMGNKIGGMFAGGKTMDTGSYMPVNDYAGGGI
jgi:hypothetical protein